MVADDLVIYQRSILSMINKAKGTPLRGAFGLIKGIRRADQKTVLRTVLPPRILCQAAVRRVKRKQGNADDQNSNPPPFAP